MTWTSKANCRQLPTDWWYPAKPITPEAAANLDKARALCDTCEVKAECLEAGMTEEYGIWGGLSPKQRKRLRKEQQQ